MNKQKKKLGYKLIYNPHAGLKRKVLTNLTSLEEIKELLSRYQLPVDFSPTKGPGDATRLARDAVGEGYHTVLVAGGDGTVGEAVNGLIGTKVNLGILPLGSFMNVAHMLSIPTDLEKAILLIKVGRKRKIDVGVITQFSGEKLNSPHYFLESAGIGIEAQLHEDFLEIERGNKLGFIKIIKTLFEYYGHKAKIILDDKKIIETRAPIIAVSNGPFTGANIPLAPRAKLNDHYLTVTIFKMPKLEALRYLLTIYKLGKRYHPKIKIFKAKKVSIETRVPRLIHADARFYGKTPITLKIKPNALNVITGFPEDGESFLVKRTYLDP